MTPVNPVLNSVLKRGDPMRVSDMDIDRIYIDSAVRTDTYHMTENHFHYYYELYYVRHGKVKFFVDNSYFVLESGDFIMIPPNKIHYAAYLSNCTRINIYFRYEDLCDIGKPFIHDLEDRFLRVEVISVPRTYRDLIHHILDTMLTEDNIDDASTKTMMVLLLRQLLLNFNRYCIFHTDPEGANRDEAILSAVQYISKNYHSNITLDELAGMANLSPSYFSRKFRAITGSGMKEYLTYVRLSHAQTELLTTNNSITDIAINCGFSDSNYFKDAFKKVHGMSPRTYRNSKIKNYLMGNDGQ